MYNRRTFMKSMVVVGTALLTGLWYRMLRTQEETRIPDVLTVSLEGLQPVNFVDGTIIVRNDNGSLEVFSDRCTHLGCRLNRVDGERILCPCHGSAFAFNGEVMQGPALRNLDKLDYTIDADRQQITILL